MTGCDWLGVGDYDQLLTLTEAEMRALAAHYGVAWSFFTELPAKSLDGRYFCFVSFSRRVLALLPFLSLAFGGMYDELPLGGEETPLVLDFSDYALEDFTF